MTSNQHGPYIRGDTRVTMAWTKGSYLATGCHEYYGKMDELMSQLNNSFVRCHNSYVVNIGKIMGMDRDKFIMGDNSEIPISRMYYKPAKERFLDHIENTF